MNAPDSGTKVAVLNGLCKQLSDEIQKVLPPGTGCVLMLRSPGEKGPLAYLSNMQLKAAIALVYDWLSRAGGEPADDDVELERTLRESLALLRATLGKGLSLGVLSPARALAFGVLSGIAFMSGDDPREHVLANRAIAFLETALAALPAADAELAAERTAAQS